VLAELLSFAVKPGQVPFRPSCRDRRDHRDAALRTDVQMPVRDGCRVASLGHDDPRGADPPIVAMTPDAMPADRPDDDARSERPWPSPGRLPIATLGPDAIVHAPIAPNEAEAVDSGAVETLA
jgi:CheY-like chemotaxis protein